MDEKSTESSSRWLVFPCPACGEPVKIPKEKINLRVGCPHCHAALRPNEEAGSSRSVPLSETDFGAWTAAGREQTVSDEFATASGDGQAEEITPGARAERAETHLKKLRKRRKKRAKVTVTTPEWDMTDEEVDEIEGDDDHEEYDTSYVEVDPDDPTKLRRKKMRRKKNLTSGQRLFQKAAVAAGFFGMALAAVIGVYGVVRALGVQAQEEAGKEAVNRGLLDELAKPRIGEGEVTQRTDAYAVIKQYLAAPTVEDKVKLVRHPEAVRQKMAKHYELHPIRPVEDFTVEYSSFQPNEEKSFVAFQVKYEDGAIQNFILEKSEPGKQDSTYKVEWELSESWMPMTWEQFKQERPIAPVEMRVEMRPADYYFGEFADQDEFTSYEIRYQDELVGMYGFISNDEPESVYLDGLLEFSDTVNLIVELRYPENSSDWNMVIIDRILQRHWIKDYGTPKTASKSGGEIR